MINECRVNPREKKEAETLEGDVISLSDYGETSGYHIDAVGDETLRTYPCPPTLVEMLLIVRSLREKHAIAVSRALTLASNSNGAVNDYDFD